MRTRETIEAQASDKSPTNAPVKKSQHPNSRKNLVAPWKPGQSGNPGGRPKNDVAQEIARAVFENNPEMIYKAFARSLAKGHAFAFQVISDRAYGKLKESREIGAEFNEIPDSNLEERVTQLERELYPAVYPGLAREAGEAARAGSSKGRAKKANGAAKDTHVLPGNGTTKA